MINLADLKLPPLLAGKHSSPEAGMCAMELVAFIERLPHSDSPPCTCPVLGAFVRRGNDAMGDAIRQRLLAYLPRLVGTVSPEHELARGECAAWAAITVFAPLALDASGLHQHAQALRTFDRVRGLRAAADAAYTAANEAYTAYTAYTAANEAADAANGAADAANSGNAADAASYAGGSATAAAAWDAWFVALDGMLTIGPQGRFTQQVPVAELAALVVE